MKGIAPILIGLFIIGVVAIAETAYLTNFVSTSQPIIRTARETEIIRGINRLEFAKQYLLKSALYSYYQASYDIARRGGYFNLTSNSYNCIPYWDVYSEEFVPDLQTNLKNAISSVFTKYIINADFEGVTIPTSFLVDISSHQTLTINSAETLKVGTEDFYTAEELFSFSQTIDGKVFNLYAIGKDIKNSTLIVEKTASSFSDLQSKLNLLQDALNVYYKPQNMQITISAENLASDESNYAARILVSLSNNSIKYPSYDFTAKTFVERGLTFNFYLLEGKSSIQQTNNCENISY
jgi:hypothetical protein